MRPCQVDGKNALFHTWSNESEVIPPSILKGGHAGGTVQTILGIVEFDDGQIAKVYPQRIKFIDRE